MIRKLTGTAVLLALVGTVWAASGDLDTGFGDGGVVHASTPTLFESLAVQGQGGFVAVGGDVVRRYLNDGSVDSSFGVDGETTLDGFSAFHVVVDSSDRVLVAGTLTLTVSGNGKGKKGSQTSTTDVLAVARLLSDGSLDTNFGSAGFASLDVSGSSQEEGRAVRIDGDGNIVVAGMARATSSSGGKHGKKIESDAVLVARFTSDGILDTLFGNGSGYVVDDFTTGDNDVWPGDVGIQSSGNIVVLSWNSFTAQEGILTRYSSSGVKDTDFGDVSTGIVMPRGLVVLGDDGILVSGSVGVDSDEDAAVAQFDSSGAVDTTFGTDGVATSGHSGRDEGYGITVDSNGKIVFAVSDIPGLTDNNSDVLVLRLNADGSFDTSFGTDGVSDIVDSAYDEASFAVMVDDAGEIVGAGGAILKSGSTYTNVGQLVRWLAQ